MNLSVKVKATTNDSSEQIVAFSYFLEKKNTVDLTLCPENYRQAFKSRQTGQFCGQKEQILTLPLDRKRALMLVGLGEKKPISVEDFRNQISKIITALQKLFSHIVIDLDTLERGASLDAYLLAATESFYLTRYRFVKYKTTDQPPLLDSLTLLTQEASSNMAKLNQAIKAGEIHGTSVNITRDLVNECPNFLTPSEFAGQIKQLVQDLPHVKIKILKKAGITKEKMGMFLAVNAGSIHEPHLVHLEYRPTPHKSQKHIALVGKGLTFDSGGYSLKPPGSMINMKFDMAGAATVFGAFRAAVLRQSPHRISCYLGITDNAISNTAITPDTIVTARNGKTVEIQNTDAEGRLVLGDVIHYAGDSKPDVIIDVATLTGAILVALGSEICGLFGNNTALSRQLMDCAKQSDENLWELPIIKQFHEEIKSEVADLKNIGESRFGGSAKAAAFLESFLPPDIKWAHLDIAGIGDSQKHLAYCPKKGSSGLIVRTLINYLLARS